MAVAEILQAPIEEASDLIYIRTDEARRLIDVMLAQPGGRLAALMFASSFVDYEARVEVLAYVDLRIGNPAP